MNLILRMLSVLVLLPIVLTLLHLGGWYMFGLALVVGALALFEYGSIVIPDDGLSRAALVVVGVAMIALGMHTDSVAVGVAAVQLAGVALAILYILRTGEFETAWRRLSLSAFGLLYIALAMVGLFRLRELGDGMDNEWARPTWIYVALIVTWSNDTFAYFAGRTLGRHKMYPKISPGKTWEGLAGGVAGAIAMLFVFQLIFPKAFGHFTALDFIIVGLPAACLGPLGDLAESMLKRNHGVKDSGKTIPGHGGLLDRIDALIFVVPWVLVYALGIRPLLS